MSESRMVPVDDLVMVGDAATILGVDKSTVGNWAIRFDDFPAPVAQLSRGRVYLMSEILAWAVATWPGRFTHGREW